MSNLVQTNFTGLNAQTNAQMLCIASSGNREYPLLALTDQGHQIFFKPHLESFQYVALNPLMNSNAAYYFPGILGAVNIIIFSSTNYFFFKS